MIDWPIAIFMVGTLVVTASLAWIVKAIVHIGHAAAQFPKEHTP